MKDKIVTTDSRGRVSIGVKDQTYRVTEREDGSIFLVPVTAYTHGELSDLVGIEAADRVFGYNS